MTGSAPLWSFDDYYRISGAPAMRAVERVVCGCEYGATSWTTRAEADRMVGQLELRSGTTLLDIGAGAGWPALYLAKLSGCDLTLVDLPGEGLRIAAERAAAERCRGKVSIVGADAARIPLPDNRFDAISHSDALCCLVEKQAVLSECRRVAREGARMVFTVILVAPGISAAQRKTAVAAGPEFVDADETYALMLERAGWALSENEDLTTGFVASLRRSLEALEENASELEMLAGAEVLDEWRGKRALASAAASAGLLRREQFAAVAA